MLTNTAFKKLVQKQWGENSYVGFSKKGADVSMPLPSIQKCEELVEYSTVWSLDIGIHDRSMDFDALCILFTGWRKTLEVFEIQDYSWNKLFPAPSLPVFDPFPRTFDSIVTNSKLKSFRAIDLVISDETLEAVCSRASLRSLHLRNIKLGKKCTGILSTATRLRELMVINCEGLDTSKLIKLQTILPNVRIYNGLKLMKRESE